MRKWVYLFNEVREVEKATGGTWDDVKGLVGGKGAGLLDMTRAGVPVPPFFTVTTEACNEYQKAGKFPAGMWEQELAALKQVEKKTGKKFGDPSNPLLVSCRSGAKFSMPGMMDTVLNLGLTDETAAGMVELTGNPRFVYDAYRRLVEMFGTVVLGIPDEAFEKPLDEYKSKKGYKLDVEMTADDWKEMVRVFREVVKQHKGFDFPQDPFKQLELATEAVFKSWNGKRAVDYRRHTNIPDDLGTAVNIVTMVFGNMGDDSGTGVAFTRNPSTGEPEMMGDYLLNAQGEDVVAGIRNTDPIENLKTKMPDVYDQFMDITSKLEDHYEDMQDVEFTIERGKLWMLQTRTGKRTAKAAVKIAVDMVNSGLITKEEAVKRVMPDQVDALLHPQFDAQAKQNAEREDSLFAKGVNASPGAAVGQIYFDADTAEKMSKEQKQDVIMVRPFTKPDDVHGMIAAKGVLPSEGGAPSHAAVVARGMGTPCVAGAGVPDDGVDHLGQVFVQHHQLYLHLGQQVDGELAAAPRLLHAALAAVSSHRRDRDTRIADLLQRRPHPLPHGRPVFEDHHSQAPAPVLAGPRISASHRIPRLPACRPLAPHDPDPVQREPGLAFDPRDLEPLVRRAGLRERHPHHPLLDLLLHVCHGCPLPLTPPRVPP